MPPNLLPRDFPPLPEEFPHRGFYRMNDCNPDRSWRKMKNRDVSGIQALLRAMECDYVSACGRFLEFNPSRDHIWTLQDKNREISALVLHSKSTLLPVFCGNKEIPKLDFLAGFSRYLQRSFPRKNRLHSVQGLKEEVIILQKILEQIGLETSDIIDYDLMYSDTLPGEINYSSGPAELILRVPQMIDLDTMAVLQAAYEQEEVIPNGSVFSPAASRINITNIISSGQVLAAELNGRLVGKINISAVSFTRYQVGGVFVHKDYRGLGIARRMAAVFISSLIKQGKGITLFVKKTNYAARKLYLNLGFSIRGDYRINYFSS
jgi:ribosomal protein S18 acetylase RimI-like enzyme